MFANNYISTIVENQLPDFIRADDAAVTAANTSAPTFTKLLKKYYEYLEQDTKTLNVGKSLYDYVDADTTRSDLLKYLKSKFVSSFPEETELSTAKVIKAAKDFYAKKGTPESFKFLFRVLYNQEVDVFFPKDEILRASDGKWKLPQALRLSFNDTLTPLANGNVNVAVTTSNTVISNGSFNFISEGIAANSYIQIGSEKRQVKNVSTNSLNVYIDFANFKNNTAGSNIYDTAKLYKVSLNEYVDFDVSKLNRRQGIGEVSRTTCTIEKAIRSVDKSTGRELVELYVSNVKRLFDAGENLVVEYVDDNGITQTFKSKIVSLISNISLFRNRFGVVQQGRRYKTGDPVVIFGGLADTPDATKAVATVRNVSTGALETVEVVNRGYFFRADPNSMVRVLTTTGIGANVFINSIYEDTTNSNTFLFNTDALGYKTDIYMNDEDGYDFDNVTTTVGFVGNSGNTKLAVNLKTANYAANTTNDYYNSFILRIFTGTGSDGSGANINTAVIADYLGTSTIAVLNANTPVTGTVNISSGSVDVVGNTTTSHETQFVDGSVPGFYTYLTAGKDIEIAGETRTIATVTNNHHLTVTSAFTTSASNVKLNANSTLTSIPDATSNVKLQVGFDTQLAKAFTYSNIRLGSIQTVQLEDSGGFFEENPTFDADSVFDTDFSIEQNYTTPWVLDGSSLTEMGGITYNKTAKTLTLPSADNHWSLSNGYYTGAKVFLDVGDTAHYAKVVDYIVTDKETSSNVKTLYLDRAFENNINQTTIKRYRLFFDLRPSVRNIGKIGTILILNGGDGYSAGDQVDFVGTGYGAAATLTISSGVITGISLTDRGEGYVEMPTIRILNSSGGATTGANAQFQVIGLSDGEEITATPDEIGKIQDFNLINRGFDYASTPLVSLKIVDILTNDLPSATVVLGGDSVWQGGATNAGATFQATVDDIYKPNTTYSVLRTFNFSGTIDTNQPLKVNTTTGNISITALSQNANISFNDVNPIEERPYPFYYGDGRAKANAEFLRGLIKYSGFYLNTDGFISADKKLQNKDYYHNFAYEIQSEKSLDDYKETIFRVAHPSGMQLLSKFNVKDILQDVIKITSNTHVQNTSTEGTVNASYLSTTVKGNGTRFVGNVGSGDLLLINTTGETASLRKYTKIVTAVTDDTTLTIESPIGDIGDGRIRTVSGNANVFISGNVSSLAESLIVGDNISFNISGTEYRREIIAFTSANVAKLNATAVSTNANVIYLKTPVYNVKYYDIIRTNG